MGDSYCNTEYYFKLNVKITATEEFNFAFMEKYLFILNRHYQS